MRSPSPVQFVLAQSACAIALTLPVAAHGGAYLPATPASTPVATPPTGPTPPTGKIPDVATGALGSGANPVTDAVSLVATWEDWWHFNRDSYLQLKRAIAAGAPATAADEIVSGKVRSDSPATGAVASRVLPVLREIVQAERATELVGAAMVALARAGEGKTADSASLTIPLLVRRLSDPNQELAETAALALGILESEESFPILQALLENDKRGQELVGGHEVPVRTRAFAAYGLGLVAHRALNNRARQVAARALCAALEDRRAAVPDVEVAAILALSIGPLEPERAPSSTAAWISRQTEIHFLQGILEDRRRRPIVRAHAVTALARLAQGAPDELAAEVAEQILAEVRGRSRLENEVLQSCAQALGLLGDADADLLDRKIRNSLGTLLDDPDVQTRSFALIALAEVGSREGSPGGDDEVEGSTGCRNMISSELVHGRGLARPWAAIALGVLERRILDQVGDLEADGPPSGARGAGSSELVPSRASREILRKYFAGARSRTHIGAGALALGLCRDRRAVPMLIERLGDTSEDQGQGYIALALGMIGQPEAVEPLQQLARTAKYRPALLEQIATGLALLGNKPTSTELAELLAQAQGQFAQISYSNALGRIGDDRAVDPLLEMIGRKGLTSSARGFAAAALGQVADPSLLPWYTPISTDLNYQAKTSTLIAGDGSGLLEIL